MEQSGGFLNVREESINEKALKVLTADGEAFRIGNLTRDQERDLIQDQALKSFIFAVNKPGAFKKDELQKINIAQWIDELDTSIIHLSTSREGFLLKDIIREIYQNKGFMANMGVNNPVLQ